MKWLLVVFERGFSLVVQLIRRSAENVLGHLVGNTAADFLFDLHHGALPGLGGGFVAFASRIMGRPENSPLAFIDETEMGIPSNEFPLIRPAVDGFNFHDAIDQYVAPVLIFGD